MALHTVTSHRLDELEIVDDEAFTAHVPYYPQLKQVVVDSGYPFLVLPKTKTPRFDHSSLLNLTFWSGTAGDVLVDRVIDADVVAHVAWHHLTKKALPSSSVTSMFLGEAIASAYDAFMIGHLLRAPSTSTMFLDSQVPLLSEVAGAAGLSTKKIDGLLQDLADDPDRAFEDLRQLLFDTSLALAAVQATDEALPVLQAAERRPLGALLHRFELSNWVWAARSKPPADHAVDVAAAAIDADLRAAPAASAWLAAHWL